MTAVARRFPNVRDAAAALGWVLVGLGWVVVCAVVVAFVAIFVELPLAIAHALRTGGRRDG